MCKCACVFLCMRVRPLEVYEQDGWQSPDVEVLDGVALALAVRTVPPRLLRHFLLFQELLQTLLQAEIEHRGEFLHSAVSSPVYILLLIYTVE